MEGLCTGCDMVITVGPKAAAEIAAGEGKAKGYCAKVRERVAVIIVPTDAYWVSWVLPPKV